ncbi:MAG: RsmB/NOP family class I SAM-dependent RNA methyltransferase [Erysipelotrichaceae bacterium]|nr:RsmB/NOP family class I SAM-dependent RNA methyltransferase [Erysipelotrichaceae bacterium]
MNLPDEYLQEMKDLLKDRFDCYLAAMEQPSFNGLRINTGKITAEQFTSSAPFALRPVPWCRDGFYYSPADEPARHPYYHAGLYYLQEPSAMAPAEILPVSPGDRVLDVCSAPGGKTTRLLNRLNDSGILVSNDISFSRQKATLRNIERWGARNCYVTACDPSEMKNRFSGWFNRILVDAPCSGEGMFRRDPSLITSWKQKDSSYYPPIQKEILSSSIDMLAPGGYILYSTCTFSRCENEDVISAILEEHPDIELMDICSDFPWFERSPYLPQTVRLYPFNLDGEGHFVALMHRKGQETVIETTITNSYHDPDFDSFMELISDSFTAGHFSRINDSIYLIPDISIDTSGLRVLRSGLLLGTCHNNRFSPAQPLAMALKEEQFSQSLNFSIDDDRVVKYLRGDTLDIDDEISVWVLVCVDHQPLGFGKATGGKLRNRIDAGWIMR